VNAEIDRHRPTIGTLLAIAPHCVTKGDRGGDVADKPDLERWVDEGAKTIGMPIALEYRANVIVNIELSLAIAQPLLSVELDEELTPAPVFRP
jgi:hypothetical protein